MGLFFYKEIVMGILVRKLQSGGSLFDVGKEDMGAFVHEGFIQRLPGGAGGHTSGSRRSSGRTGKTAQEKETDNLMGGLSSDIKYYQETKDSIKSQMDAMIEADPNADKNPEYKSLVNKYYKLETEYLPQIKSMAKLYSTSKTAFGNAKAADAPAIIGNDAIVYDKENKLHKVVSNEELVKNAPNYSLLTANEVLTFRQSNPEFSGFTDLGTTAMEVINNAYGQSSFDKSIKEKIKLAGYVKKNGRYQTKSGEPLDLTGQIQGNDGETKTNAYNLNMLVDDLMGGGSASASNYLNAVAVKDLYNKSRSDNETYANLNDEDLAIALGEGKKDTLMKNINYALFVDEDADGGGTGNSVGDQLKTVYRNPITVANATLFKEPTHIEIEGAASDPLFNKVYNTPAAEIPKGTQLLNDGFAEANKAAEAGDNDYDETGDDDPYKRRTLDNNKFINKVKDSSAEITTVDGQPISSLATDNNVQFVTIPPNSKLTMLLAPVEKDEKGHEKVNFNSKEQQKIDRAIDKAYEYLEKREGFSRQDLAVGGDSKEHARAVKIANEFLRNEGVTGNLEVKLVMAFDVLYESAGDKKKYKYSMWADDQEADFLNKVNDDVWTRRVKKTKAFVPISESFYSSSFASDALGSEYQMKYDVGTWEGMLGTKNRHKYDPTQSAKAISTNRQQQGAEQKAEGGRLINPDDVIKLLF